MEVDSVLVTGANRGIGLEMVKQFLSLPLPPNHVIAACRSPETAKNLKDIQAQYPPLIIVQMDQCDMASLSRAEREVSSVLGDSGLTLLINNAGIASRDTLDTITASQMIECFKVNAVGTLMVTQTFLPMLRTAARRKKGPVSINRVAVINISSGVASIEENDTGGAYAYRSSKAALNMITKSLSIDLKKDGILVSAIHPGWVKTGMGGPNAKTDIADSVTAMMSLMAMLSGEEFTGRFYHYTGREIAW